MLSHGIWRFKDRTDDEVKDEVEGGVSPRLVLSLDLLAVFSSGRLDGKGAGGFQCWHSLDGSMLNAGPIGCRGGSARLADPTIPFAAWLHSLGETGGTATDDDVNDEVNDDVAGYQKPMK
jgi:hypothetical protein